MGFSSRYIYFPNIIKAGSRFPYRGAAFEPSPAFQSRESRYVVVSVAAATENGYALGDPAFQRLVVTQTFARNGSSHFQPAEQATE
jgi:hypothetical protein